jgi:hypothetical protein
MLNIKQIEELAVKLSQAIPDGMGKAPEQAKAQIKAVLTSSLEKLDVVSRQEYDLQVAVLAKTRAKLEALESQVAELEKRMAEQNRPMSGGAE